MQLICRSTYIQSRLRLPSSRGRQYEHCWRRHIQRHADKIASVTRSYAAIDCQSASCTTSYPSHLLTIPHFGSRSYPEAESIIFADAMGIAIGDGNQDTTQTLLSPTSASHDAPPYLPKNLSTSNLLSHAQASSPTLSLNTTVRPRYSLDAHTAMEFASMSKYVLCSWASGLQPEAIVANNVSGRHDMVSWPHDAYYGAGHP